MKKLLTLKTITAHNEIHGKSYIGKIFETVNLSQFKHDLLNTKTNTKDMLNSCHDESFYTTVQMCFHRSFFYKSQQPWLITFQNKMSFKRFRAFNTHNKVYEQVYVNVPSVTTCEALAHRSVLHARLRTGGTGWWGRLNRWCQGAEESCYEGQSQPSPGTEHGPAVTMAYIIRKAEQITWVARQFEVDAGHTGAQRDDAEGTCGGT